MPRLLRSNKKYNRIFYKRLKCKPQQNLKKAAKQCSEMGANEQKRCLKSVFLTHRQMGICEAFMKILPEIRFKDSSIGTDFLVLGRREEMSRYLVRAHVPEIEEEELLKNCEKLFKKAKLD